MITSSALAPLLRFHKFILTKRRGSRNEIAELLGVGKNRLAALRRMLINHGAEIKYNHEQSYYEYLNDFEFYIGPAGHHPEGASSEEQFPQTR